MDYNDTAYNQYVLCSDCEFGLNEFTSAAQEFKCPRWGDNVKNVGICKYYKRCDHGDSRD